MVGKTIVVLSRSWIVCVNELRKKLNKEHWILLVDKNDKLWTSTKYYIRKY